EAAVRVDIGYYAFGAGSSAGTRASSVGILVDPTHTFRDGVRRATRTAERVRSFTVRGKEREAVSIGGSEQLALPGSFPQLREVNVYLGWFGALARPLQAASLGTSLATRLPGARSLLHAVGDRAAGLVSGPQPGGGVSWVVAEAYDAGGNRLADVQLSGPEPYALTAALIAWAAQQRVDVPGALGPLQAFGIRALEEGCRGAGLERVRAGV